MDIANLSIAMSTINTQTAFGTRMLDMSLEDLEMQGENLIEMLSVADVNPDIGNNVDIQI